MFIGRKEELNFLEDRYNSADGQLIVLYGRRRVGKTTFIVNVKQSESAKKPLNTVFQEICRHEMLGVFSADKYLNLENLQKSS